MTRRWERVTGAVGLLTIVLLLAELATWQNPQFSDPISRIRHYFVVDRGLANASVLFAALVATATLIFAAGLRAVLRRIEGDTDVLSTILFGSAVGFAAVQMVFAAVSGAIVLSAGQATDREIRLLVGMDDPYLDTLRILPLALMVGAASLAMLSGPGFARWIGWVGVASAALNLVGEISLLDPTGPIGDVGNASQVGLLFFLVWAVALSITLIRRPVAVAGELGPAR